MAVELNEVFNGCEQLLLDNSTHGTSVLSVDRRQDLIKNAVKIYSKRRPLLKLSAQTGTTNYTYDFPSNWEDHFSTIYNIEYPINKNPPEYIRTKDYMIDLMTGGYQLRFLRNQPSNGETFWLRYFIRHSFDADGVSEIPDADINGVIYISMVQWCSAYAQHYASKADNLLENTELIAQPTRVQEYSDLSSKYMKMFDDTIPANNEFIYDEVGFMEDEYWYRGDL